LKECGILCWKNKSVGTFSKDFNTFLRLPSGAIKGVSDILGCLSNGRILAIEVKTRIGRPTQDQLKFISDIQANNGIAFISRSVSQTYSQLVSIEPGFKSFEHIAKKYEKIEHKQQQ